NTKKRLLWSTGDLDSANEEIGFLKSEVIRVSTDARGDEAYRLLTEDKKKLAAELKGKQDY
ncbi:hypothetical protein U1Q18_014892, partial [Sarracenia purpurea var. burkii]